MAVDGSQASSAGGGGGESLISLAEDQLASASDGSLFSLKWNEFDRQLALGFSSLYHTQELADVTLCCDGKSAQAHKIVLAMCSPYFRQIFKEHPCQHPVVIIKGIQSHQLQHVLQFMYFGQVSVAKRDIQNFIEAAELLKLDGITANDSLEHGSRSSTRPSSTPTTRQFQHEASKGEESMFRLSSSGYPAATVSRISYEKRSGSSKPMEVQSLMTAKIKDATSRGEGSSSTSSSPSMEPHPRRFSSRGSEGSSSSSIYSESIPHLASVIRTSHIPATAVATSWTSQPRVSKEGLTFSQGMISPLMGMPVSPPAHGRDPASSSSTTISPGSPFLEPPVPVVVNLEEKPEEYDGIMETSSQGGEGEYELSIRSIPSTSQLSSYSKAFKTSSGIVSASVVRPSLLRKPPSTSPSGSEPVVDPLSTTSDTVLHLPSIPAKKRFSHLNPALMFSSSTEQDQSLVIRPVFTGGGGGTMSASACGSSGASTSSTEVQSVTKTRAHRQSQVPQSARYTSAQVDAIVDAVNDHSGPCVPCKICDKWVKRERLRAHIHECHLVHGEKIICPHCGVALKSKGSYRVHVWRHRRGVLARGLKSKRVIGGQRPRLPSSSSSQPS